MNTPTKNSNQLLHDDMKVEQPKPQTISRWAKWDDIKHLFSKLHFPTSKQTRWADYRPASLFIELAAEYGISVEEAIHTYYQ